MDLAKEVAEILAGLSEVERADPALPGFVNLTLSPEVIWENLKTAIRSPNLYGRNQDLIPEKIIIEFVSANPTGPLHLASGRGGALGDSLVRILRRLGHEASAEYYVNDAGNQIQKFGKSLWARRHGQEVSEDGYHGDYVAELAKSFPSEADSWTEEKLAAEGIAVLLKSHQDDMKAFGVSFDRWFRESELHESKALEKTLELLKKRGMVYQKDGATWLGTSASSEDDKDRGFFLFIFAI